MLGKILSMGGYGAYVWSAYCITWLVFGINTIASLRERKQVKRKIQKILARQISS